MPAGPALLLPLVLLEAMSPVDCGGCDPALAARVGDAALAFDAAQLGDEETLAALVEEEGAFVPRGGARESGAWRGVLAALLPTVGVRLSLPGPGGRDEGVVWEFFVVWGVRTP